MKKALRIIALLIVILIGIAVIGYLNIGSLVKKGVEGIGPQVTQGPMSLGGFKLNIFTGKAKISDLKIGNPEGFDEVDAISLGSLDLKLDPKSLMGGDTIHIYEIVINEPEIFVEGLKAKNLIKLSENAESYGKKPMNEAEKAEAKEKAKEEAKAQKEAEKNGTAKPTKKVVIDKLTIVGGKVKLKTLLTAGVAAPIPLPKIEINDIGKEKDANIADVFTILISEITGAVFGLVSNVGGLGVDAVKGVGGIGADTVKGVGGLLGGVVKAATGQETDDSEISEEDKEKVEEGVKAIKGIGASLKDIVKTANKNDTSDDSTLSDEDKEKIGEAVDDIDETVDEAVKEVKGLLNNFLGGDDKTEEE